MTFKSALTIHPKVSGAVIASQLALIGIWVVEHWVEVPPEIAGYVISVAVAIGGWLAPGKSEAPKP